VEYLQPHGHNIPDLQRKAITVKKQKKSTSPGNALSGDTGFTPKKTAPSKKDGSVFGGTT
jgi:hypothetical protein